MMKQNKETERVVLIYEKNGGAFLKKLLHYFVINRSDIYKASSHIQTVQQPDWEH